MKYAFKEGGKGMVKPEKDIVERTSGQKRSSRHQKVRVQGAKDARLEDSANTLRRRRKVYVNRPRREGRKKIDADIKN